MTGYGTAQCEQDGWLCQVEIDLSISGSCSTTAQWIADIGGICQGESEKGMPTRQVDGSNVWNP